MPGTDDNLISQFSDQAALKADTDFIKGLLTDLNNSFQAVISTRDKLSGGISLKDIVTNGSQAIQTTKDLATGLNALKQAQDQVNASTKAGNSTSNTNTTTQTTAQTKATKELTQAQAELNIIQKSINADNTQAAKQALGLVSAYDELQSAFKNASASAKDLQAQALINPELQEQANAASIAANELNEKLKIIDAGVGSYQRNVGNYTGAINTLKESLATATSALEAMTEAGTQNTKQGIALATEVEQLGVLVGQQSNGFQSLTREVATTGKQLITLQEQLINLKNAGLEDSEAFAQLQSTIQKLTPVFVEAKQSLTELQKQQKLIASEAPGLSALTLAAKGLGGAYAVGAGAAALFAGDNQKVQKTINDLVAVMTILQGLQAVEELLLEKNGIAMVLFGKSVVATTAELGFFAGALEFIEANPIVLILTALAAVALIVVDSIEKQSEAFENSAKAAKDYGDAIKGLTEVNNDLNNQLTKGLQDQKKALEDQLASQTALGINEDDKLKLKLQIADIDKKIADAALAQNPNIEKQLADQNDELTKKLSLQQQLQKTVEDLAEKQKNGVEKISKTVDNGTDPAFTFDQDIADALKAAQNEKKINDEAVTSLKASVDAQQKIKENAGKADQNEINTNLEIEAKAIKDKRNLIFTEAQNEISITQDKNKNILASDQSTFTQKLNAIKSNAQAEKDLARDKNNNIQTDDTKTPEEKITAEQEYLNKIALINADARETERAETEKYLKSIAQAKLDFYNSDISADSKYQKELSVSQALGADERVEAYSKYITDEQNTIIADAKFKLQYGNLNAEQKIALQEETNNKLLDLQRQSVKDISAIIVSGANDELALQSAIDKQALASKELALANSIGNQKNALQQFNKQKAILEDEGSIDEIKKEIIKDQLLLNSTLLSADNRYKIELDLHNKIAALDQKELDDKLKKDELAAQAEQKLNDDRKKLAEEAFTLIQTLGDAQFTNAINNIEAQKTALTDLTQRQIDAENSTTDSAADKANKIAVINATAAAKQAQLDEKEKQQKIQQAKFDKAINIAKIIEATALAVIGALAETPGPVGVTIAETVGAIGAAQLATAIATPIPQFKHGLDHDYQGLAIEGDGGVPEVHTKADGSFYFTKDTPTLTHVDMGDRIYPNIDEWISMLAHNAYTGQPLPAAPGQDNGHAVAGIIKSEMQGLKSAIMNKREIHMNRSHRGEEVYFKNGNNWLTYKNNQTNW